MRIPAQQTKLKSAMIFVLMLIGSASCGRTAMYASEVSEFEQVAIKQRMSIDNIRAEVRTEVLACEKEAGFESLDCYWIGKGQARRDSYKGGNRNGIVYRAYRKPKEAAFFTNEQGASGGEVILELREEDPTAVPQDLRLIGMGIGTLRQPQDGRLRFVGTHKDSPRTVRDIKIDGMDRKEILYEEEGGCEYRMVLAPEQGYQPVLIEGISRPTIDGVTRVLGRESAEIELQQVERPGNTPIWFPKRIVYRYVRDAETIRETVEEVQIGDVNPSAFTLASLDIPVGHTVYDMRTMKTGPWNGKEVEYEQDIGKPVPPGGSSNLSLIVFLLIGILLFVCALIARQRRVRRHAKSA